MAKLKDLEASVSEPKDFSITKQVVNCLTLGDHDQFRPPTNQQNNPKIVGQRPTMGGISNGPTIRGLSLTQNPDRSRKDEIEGVGNHGRSSANVIAPNRESNEGNKLEFIHVVKDDNGRVCEV